MKYYRQFKGEKEIEEVTKENAEDRLKNYWKEVDWENTSKAHPIWTPFTCYWQGI